MFVEKSRGEPCLVVESLGEMVAHGAQTERVVSSNFTGYSINSPQPWIGIETQHVPSDPEKLS